MSIQNYGSQNPTPVKVSQVSDELIALNDMIGTVTDRVLLLTERIARVRLIPPAAATGTTPPPKAPMCDLASDIASARGRLALLLDTVNQVLSELEL